MSMIATLTLSGLVDYRPDVFDNLVLPTPPIYAADIGLLPDQLRQAWTINKSDFIDFLCLRTMSMSLAVPDADFFKKAVEVWSKAHIHEWQRLFETLFYKYNPLWNKDFKLTEAIEDENTKRENETNGNLVAGNNTVTGYTHGYNDGGSVHEDDGLAWTHSDKTKGTNSVNTSGTRTNNSTGTGTRDRTVTEQGNIGVTMVQDMVEKERELALFSLEEYLADEFCKNFMLMIW